MIEKNIEEWIISVVGTKEFCTKVAEYVEQLRNSEELM